MTRRLVDLLGALDARGERLSPCAGAFVAARVAALAADRHDAMDAGGRPEVLGWLSPRTVLVDDDGAASIAPIAEPIEPFAAPEVMAGGRLTPRADVFSAGALAALLIAEPSAEVKAAIGRAIEPDPAQRRITCVELQAWIEQLDPEGAGRRELAATLERLSALPPPAPQSPRESRPIARISSVIVATMTAAFVVAAGEIAIRALR